MKIVGPGCLGPRRLKVKENVITCSYWRKRMSFKPRQISSFSAFIEFTPAVTDLLSSQDKLIGKITSLVMNEFLESGKVDLTAPRASRMKEEDDYLSLKFGHDTHDFRLDVLSKGIGIRKGRCRIDPFRDFLRLMELVHPKILEMLIGGRLSESRYQVSDYNHRFVVISRILSENKKNYDLLNRVLELTKEPLSSLEIAEVFRADVSVSFFTDKFPGRNILIKTESPANENNKLVWLTVDVKPFPVERMESSSLSAYRESTRSYAFQVLESFDKIVVDYLFKRFGESFFKDIAVEDD